jgi:molybdenum cofactor biosynthesis protein B
MIELPRFPKRPGYQKGRCQDRHSIAEPAYFRYNYHAKVIFRKKINFFTQETYHSFNPPRDASVSSLSTLRSNGLRLVDPNSIPGSQESSMSVREHREQAQQSLRVAVLTVSDTRTLENDLGGNLIQSLLEQAGHQVSDRRIVQDECQAIRVVAKGLLEAPQVDALLVTGGTGLAARDQTTEAIEALYDAMIPGYGELFRMLSYQEIGAAAMLSRASGGRHGKQVVLTMPGSPAGVQLAMEKLIVPELPHLVHHAGK